MVERLVDMETWPRAAQFRFFRTYDRPHYAITSRIDVTPLVERKADGVSIYRGSLFAIGAGLQAVPELRMRMRGAEQVVLHETVALSMTVPQEGGSFGYVYVPMQDDWADFDVDAKARIDKVAKAKGLDANAGQRDDVAYLSCLPWMDYTSLNNAMPGPEDCIPRVSWGKIMPTANGFDMAMTLEVHHALVDGEHVGAFFEAVGRAIKTAFAAG